MGASCPKCHHDNPPDTLFCGKCATRLDGPGAGVSFTRTMETPRSEYGRGTVFAGRFEVIEELGAGGMGRVLRAFDKEVGEEVAVKLLHPEIALDKRTVERFRNEIKLARKITHKNVCRMHELHQEGTTLFITMEFVSGQDLKGLIKQTGALTAGKAVSIARQVAEGLAEAHGLGVVHRDLKPQNIMVDKDGNAKVMDFGIARSLHGAAVTAEGSLVGTPDYMSPEQVESKGADQRSDIYALGVILFEMVTGRVPFEGDTPLSVAYKHKNELPVAPRKLNSQVPEPLNKVILRCLEKEKANRYQTAGELLSDLALVEEGLPITERVAAKTRMTAQRSALRPSGLRRLFVPSLVALGIVVAVGLVLWRILPGKSVPSAPLVENSVALISFQNQTGDPAFDNLCKAIPNLLITSLEQQSSLYVASWERMRDILKQMGHGNPETIDRDSGFEICRREGIGAIVIGSFVKLGDTFVTDVKVLDSKTKRSLKSASSRGTGIDSIFAQIDELSRQIASGIGLAETQIAAAQRPVADVSTGSMDAYDFYLSGVREFYRLNGTDSRRHLEKAVELDPSFAVAYLQLSEACFFLGDPKAGLEALERAIKFSDKATEKERLQIEAASAERIEKDPARRLRILQQLTGAYPREKEFHEALGTYYVWNTDKVDKAIEEFRRALELDPNYAWALNMLGLIYSRRGEYEKALPILTRYVELSPGDANPLDSLANLYYAMGDLDKTIEILTEALALKPDFYVSLIQIPHVYALKEDHPEAVRWLERLVSVVDEPGQRFQGYIYLGFHHIWQGRLAKALDDLAMGSKIAREIGNPAAVAVADYLSGWITLEQDDLDKSKRFFQSSLDYATGTGKQDWTSRQIPPAVALALGLAELDHGRIEQAKLGLKEIDSALAKGSEKRNIYRRDMLSAEILLKEGLPAAARSEFEKAPILDEPSMQWWIWVVIHNIPPLKDILGRSYAQEGDLDKAIAEYEKLTKFDPKSKSRYLIHPKYHFRLARLYEQKGQKAKAIDRYRRFLELWKDADPGQPEVDDARMRVEALK